MHERHAYETVGDRVGAGENSDHAGRVERAAGPDRADSRVWMRRPHEPCVRLTRDRKIVGEATLTAEQTIIFQPAHRLTDPLPVADLRGVSMQGRGGQRPKHSAACTACERGCAAERNSMAGAFQYSRLRFAARLMCSSGDLISDRPAENLDRGTTALAMARFSCALAQTAAKVPVSATYRRRPATGIHSAFRQGLADLGYVEGRTIVIEERYAGGDPSRFPELIDDLLSRNIDVFVTGGAVVTQTVLKRTVRVRSWSSRFRIRRSSPAPSPASRDRRHCDRFCLGQYGSPRQAVGVAAGGRARPVDRCGFGEAAGRHGHAERDFLERAR